MFRFRRNAALERDLKRSTAYEEYLAGKAEEVAQAARDAAPVDTGHYRRSIKTDGHIVYTDDVAGHLIEFGSAKNPPYAPLRRGAHAAGLRLDERSK
jgi:hypothetical protein